jgi:methylase of polypeptide subunit release factors
MFIKTGGFVLREVGDGQAEKVAGLFEQTGEYDLVETLPDFNGIDRVVRTRRHRATTNLKTQRIGNIQVTFALKP